MTSLSPQKPSTFIIGLFFLATALCQAQSKFKLTLQEGHTGYVRGVKFLKQKNWLVTASTDKSIIIWDLATGRQVENILISPAEINAMDVSPDGRFIAIGTGDLFTKGNNYLKVYDLELNKEVFSTVAHNDRVVFVSFSFDGRFIATGADDATKTTDFAVKVWDTKKWKMVNSHVRHGAGVVAGAWTPDNTLISFGGGKGILWNPESNAFSQISQPSIGLLSYSQRDNIVLAGTRTSIHAYAIDGTNTKQLWQIENIGADGATRAWLHGNKVYAISFASENNIKCFSTETRQLLYQTTSYNVGNITLGNHLISGDYWPEQNYLAVGNLKGQVELYYTGNDQFFKVHRLRPFSQAIADMSFTNDERYFVPSTYFGAFTNVMDLESGNALYSLKKEVNYATLSPNGAYLAYQEYVMPRMTEVVDLASGKITGKVKRCSWEPLAFTPDSEHLSKVWIYDSIYGPERYRFLTIKSSTGQVISDITQPFPSSTESKPIPGTDLIAYASQSNQLALVNIKQKKLKYSVSPAEFTRFLSIDISKDGKQIVTGHNTTNASVWNAEDGKFLYTLTGHQNDVTAVGFAYNGSVATGGMDRTVRLYDNKQKLQRVIQTQSGVESIDFIRNDRFMVVGLQNGAIEFRNPLDGEMEVTCINAMSSPDYVIFTKDGYYKASPNGTRGVHFVDTKTNKVLLFDQFDLKYNRPDIVLKRLGGTDTLLITSYYNAWQKRVRRMGLNPDIFEKDLPVSTPDLVVVRDKKTEFNDRTMRLKLKATDAGSTISTLHIYINGVPVYGQKGMKLTPLLKTIEKDVTVTLSNGRNSIEVFVQNTNGIKSLSERFVANYVGTASVPDLYVIGVGISDFVEKEYNLSYAAKDARDMVNLYNGNKRFGNIVTKTLTDTAASASNLAALKSLLAKTKEDDIVVFFVASHGLLDDEFNYYIALNGTSFDSPSKNGYPYENLEDLLDNIPARNKLMLIDACHSGEVDKENTELVTVAKTETKSGVKTRGFKTVKEKNENGLGLKSSFELMKELFADIRKGTGTVVIASASGSEFAFESSAWKNGVFTYAFINGLKNGLADTNKDGQILVSEVQQFVEEEVKKLTDGKQHPTSRRDNIEFDFPVW